MRGLSFVCLAAAGLIAAAAAASAQEPANQSAEQNVRASHQYESALCANPAFRAKRIAQECGPVTDPQLHAQCIASFAQDEPYVGSSMPPRPYRSHYGR